MSEIKWPNGCGMYHAVPEDSDKLLQLYKSLLGSPCCVWDEHYPNMDTIRFDMDRDAVFVLKNEEGRILAAVSIDLDEEVEALPCWNRDLAPMGELSRLAVDASLNGLGMGGKLLQFGMEELKRRGYLSCHFLVNKHHLRAQRAYAHVEGLKVVGECELFDQPFLCYEKEL